MAKQNLKPPTPGTYQHYKGTFYEVLGTAEDPETGNRYVVYQNLGITENLLEGKGEPEGELPARVVKNGAKGELAVCSIERFTEAVDGGPYWDGQKAPRFRLVVPASRT
jgi:hypothetical protein